MAPPTDPMVLRCVPHRPPILRVHTPYYVDFLEHVHAQWRDATGAAEMSRRARNVSSVMITLSVGMKAPRQANRSARIARMSRCR